MGNRIFSAGDRVCVRSAEEILATLDADGTLDNLPFMPQMLEWCGRTFRVQRRAYKSCVSGHRMRQFISDDVVILDSPRCDGNAQDGCRHGCRIFWKEAWLRPAQEAAPTATSASEVAALRARLKVKMDESRYFCQSTELLKATRDFPKTQRRWSVRIMAREIRSGDLPVAAILRMLTLWAWQRFRRKTGGDRWLQGPHKRTPSESLGLQPGERVRIKSRDEIAQTLDQNGRNRGMSICTEMTRCSGHEAEVRYRVDRIIDETTGRMRGAFRHGDAATDAARRGHRRRMPLLWGSGRLSAGRDNVLARDLA